MYSMPPTHWFRRGQDNSLNWPEQFCEYANICGLKYSLRQLILALLNAENVSKPDPHPGRIHQIGLLHLSRIGYPLGIHHQHPKPKWHNLVGRIQGLFWNIFVTFWRISFKTDQELHWATLQDYKVHQICRNMRPKNWQKGGKRQNKILTLKLKCGFWVHFLMTEFRKEGGIESGAEEAEDCGNRWEKGK